MRRNVVLATVALLLAGGSAQAADCGAVVDELTKAISGHLTMSHEKKVSMLRMTLSGYDHCMAGDTKHSGNVRDMIMTQIKESLGGR